MFTLQNTLAKTVQLKNKDITKGVSDCPSFQITKGPQKDKVVSKSNEWTIKEVTKYIVVLERKAEVLEGKPQSQLWEQYKEMAKFIKTRNYRQCKIYHQKLFSQFENVLDITENLLRTQLIQTT